MSPEAELAALYHQDLRDWAAEVRNDKRLAPADITMTRNSRNCGSSVTLDIRRDKDRIFELGWRVRACTLGMASTAIVVQNAPGQSFEDVAAIAATLRRQLAGDGAIFPERWRDLAVFAAAKRFPTRHNSIMLAFDVLRAADPHNGQ